MAFKSSLYYATITLSNSRIFLSLPLIETPYLLAISPNSSLTADPEKC